MPKLSVAQLRQIVKEEVEKLEKVEDRADDTEEVEAGEYADTLKKHVDMIKALKIKESELKNQLAKIQEKKIFLAKKLVK